jgi:hypothetical protein
MKVVCVANQGTALPADYLDPQANLTPKATFSLTLEKAYVVYAIAIRGGQVWYYVVDDDDLWYPTRKAAPLFRAADARVSQYWHCLHTPGNLDHHVLLAFEEWASEPGYYDRLSDRAPREVQIFRDRRGQIDKEASVTIPCP